MHINASFHLIELDWRSLLLFLIRYNTLSREAPKSLNKFHIHFSIKNLKSGDLSNMEEEISQAESKEKKELTIEEFKQRLGECQKLKDEYLAGWQRARADFLNYKKEEMERIGGLMAYANEELILKILPILDNFEIAEKKILGTPENDENPERQSHKASIKGILQLKNQILDFLKNHGVEEIKSIGEKFDPNFHEVIEMVEPKDSDLTNSPQDKSGTIIEEIQKGYKINDRLLRPAKVKVVK